MQHTVRLLIFGFIFSAFYFSTATCIAQVNTQISPLSGHRIEITNVEIIKQKSKSLQIYVDVVNTGRFDIVLGKDKRLPYLEVGFDDSMDRLNLSAYQEAVKEKLLQQKLKINVGETKSRFYLKVKSSGKTMTAPAYSIIPPVDKSKVEKSETTASTKDDRLNTPPVNESPAKEVETGSFVIPVFESKKLDEIIKEKESCPDLIIESIEVVKSDSKKAVLKYVLKNIGKGDAEIYDHADKNSVSLGIRAYISGSAELSKGSFPIDGSYVESGLGSVRGTLRPGESVTVNCELDVRRKTRYMSVIILSADAFLKLRECDRTNNTNHVLLD